MLSRLPLAPLTGTRAKTWCLLIHAEASLPFPLSLPLAPRRRLSACPPLQYVIHSNPFDAHTVLTVCMGRTFNHCYRGSLRLYSPVRPLLGPLLEMHDLFDRLLRAVAAAAAAFRRHPHADAAAAAAAFAAAAVHDDAEVARMRAQQEQELACCERMKLCLTTTNDDDDEHQTRAVDGPAVQAVVAAMRAYPQSEQVQSLACQALGDMILNNTVNQTHARDAGAGQAVLAAMCAHLQSEQVQLRACEFLCVAEDLQPGNEHAKGRHQRLEHDHRFFLTTGENGAGSKQEKDGEYTRVVMVLAETYTRYFANAQVQRFATPLYTHFAGRAHISGCDLGPYWLDYTRKSHKNWDELWRRGDIRLPFKYLKQGPPPLHLQLEGYQPW